MPRGIDDGTEGDIFARKELPRSKRYY